MGILEGKNDPGRRGHAGHLDRVPRGPDRPGARAPRSIVSNFGRAMSLTGRVIKKLDPVPPLLEVDVTNEEHLAGLADALRSTSTPRRRRALAGVREPRDRAGRQVPQHALVGRRDRAPGVGLLPGLADHGLQAAAGRAGLGGRADLRRHGLLAGLRLDGRLQVGPGEHQPLPGPLPRARGRPGEPGRRRTAGDPGQEGHRRGRRVQRGLGSAGPDRLGPAGHGARRPRRSSRCSATSSPRPPAR